MPRTLRGVDDLPLAEEDASLADVAVGSGEPGVCCWAEESAGGGAAAAAEVEPAEMLGLPPAALAEEILFLCCCCCAGVLSALPNRAFNLFFAIRNSLSTRSVCFFISSPDVTAPSSPSHFSQLRRVGKTRRVPMGGVSSARV